MKDRLCNSKASPAGRVFVLTILSTLLTIFASAQVVDSFDVQANGRNIGALEQPDGKILVWGDFTTLAGQPHPGMARFHPNTSLDIEFIPQGTPPIVYCVAVQLDGKLLVGGHAADKGKPLVRLLPNGTLDPTFNAGVNQTWASVYTVQIEPSGTIVVGGIFSTPSGNTNLTRLNMDGSEVPGFSATASWGVQASKVYSVVALPDGKILVGGDFRTLCGQSCTNLGRLFPNGNVDTEFVSSGKGEVTTLAALPNGQVLVGYMGGVVDSSIRRLHANGALDRDFPAIRGIVGGLLLETNGKILVGGCLIELFARGYGIARITSEGAVDSEGCILADLPPYFVSLQSDGLVLTGGMFDSIEGVARHGFARVRTYPVDGLSRLQRTNTTLVWKRTGHVPEIDYARFYSSDNGSDWTLLGSGTRMPEGWLFAAETVTSGKYYRAVGPASCGTWNGSQMLVESRVGRTEILLQPQDQSVKLGANAQFTVKASGAGVLSSHWLKNGVVHTQGICMEDHAGNASLTLTNISHADEGEYSAVIMSDEGSITSRVATLTVLDPTIEVQPEPKIRYAGESATFSVTAVGTGPLHFQWTKDGIELTGETSSALSIGSAQFGSQGGYQVVVANSYGSVTSSIATLKVYLAADDFAPGSGVAVRAFAELPGGKILVAGQYDSIAGGACTNLGRLNPDGTLDTTFQAQVTGTVNCMVVQPDGKILIGGVLTSAGGESRQGLVRFNPDGSLDSAFQPEFIGARLGPFVMDASVAAVAIAPDGKLLVGGQFSSLGGVARNSLGRLNSDGTLDPTFDPGMEGVITNANVTSIVLQPDGRILVGGHQMRFGGVARMAIARLHPDGSLDSSLSIDAQTWVTAVALQPDGSILLGGAIVSVGGQPRKGLARILGDGSLDPNFKPVLTGSARSLVTQGNGKILVGGELWDLDGQACGKLIRLHQDGTVDGSFSCDADGAVQAIALQSDGRILLGGSFARLGGKPRQSVGRLFNTDSASDDLSFDGTTATWVMQGGSPGLNSASFQVSSNGVDWVPLGEGVATGNGWETKPPGGGGARRKLGEDADSGVAFVRARGTVIGGAENCAKWIVEKVIELLRITSQPSDQVALPGGTATFQVMAAGSGTISYQWYRDGVALSDGAGISGATSSTLVVSNVKESDGGVYSVQVTADRASASSQAALLTVDNVRIVTQLTDQNADAGQTINLIVTAVGPEPLSYQWWKGEFPIANSEQIAGADSHSLWLTNVSGYSSGQYSVVASSSLLAVTSRVAQITVKDPVIVAQPTNQLVGPCAAVQFVVVPTGTPPFSFQWRKNGAEIPGATNAVFLVATPGESDQGSYEVVVSGYFGTDASSAASLVIEPPSRNPPVMFLNSDTGDEASYRFSFGIAGACGQSVVVESSTNLVDWYPVQTNRLGNEPLNYSQKRTAHSRFFRTRLVD
jgi:uncharacterized delta-60 repeat protein